MYWRMAMESESFTSIHIWTLNPSCFSLCAAFDSDRTTSCDDLASASASAKFVLSLLFLYQLGHMHITTFIFFLRKKTRAQIKLTRNHSQGIVLSWILPYVSHGIIQVYCVHTFFFCDATQLIEYILCVVFRDATRLIVTGALAQNCEKGVNFLACFFFCVPSMYFSHYIVTPYA